MLRRRDALPPCDAVPQSPRELLTFYNHTDVPLSQLQAVLLVVANTGKLLNPLQAIDLLIDTDGPGHAPMRLLLYTAVSANAAPSCKATNEYVVPAALRSGQWASARVVGVRVSAADGHVHSRKQLLHVSLSAGMLQGGARIWSSLAACLRVPVWGTVHARYCAGTTAMTHAAFEVRVHVCA